MVFPIALAVMAAGKMLGSGLNFLEARKERAVNESLVAGQIQALDDQITIARMQSAKKVANQQGAGVVAAGASGAQFSGSIATATAQAVADTEFAKIVNIQKLRYEQRVAALQGHAKDATLSSQQLGSIISGITGGAQSASDISSAQSTDAALSEAPVAGGG